MTPTSASGRWEATTIRVRLGLALAVALAPVLILGALQAALVFQRDAHDLYCRVPIGFVTAALGGEIEVPTLSGKPARVAIPEGAQTGHQFKLRGKGMPVLKTAGHHGDLFVEVRVETPVKLTKKQKELLRSFETESPAGCNPDSESFFARMKEFLSGATD